MSLETMLAEELRAALVELEGEDGHKRQSEALEAFEKAGELEEQLLELRAQRDVLTNQMEGIAHFAPGPAGRIATEALVAVGVWGPVEATETPYPNADVESQRLTADLNLAREDRNRWIRLFNRLDGAINHHKAAGRFVEDHDERLYKARDKILELAGEGGG